MGIELFDKKYVYLEWSDELKGKDCVIAKSYKDLKDFVNSGNEGRIFKVDKGTEKPFTNHCVECDFCYFDPNMKIKKALIEGNKVQYYSSFNEWEDLSLTEICDVKDYVDNVIDWDKYEWRIKPKVYSNYQPTEPRYYLSVNKNGYLEFTISQDRTNNTIYNGTRKECERMMKIIGNEFRNCGNCGGEGISCSCCDGLRFVIDKYSHEKYKHRMTNRELSEYLAKGNGEMKNFGYGLFNISTCHCYADVAENENVDRNILIRDFGSDEWREPLIEV